MDCNATAPTPSIRKPDHSHDNNMTGNDKHIDLITGYLQGSLTPEQREELDRLATGGAIDMAQVRSMESQFRDLGRLPAPEPPPGMDERFQSMLQRERDKPQQTEQATLHPEAKIHWLQRLQTAAAIAAVFLAGLLLGLHFPGRGANDVQVQQLAADVHDLRETMLISLLDDVSAAERLRAVNISMEIASPQDRVIDALVQTLRHDPSVNVRVAAVEALVRHGARPSVRQELVRAITRQPSPIVQVALADAMIALQEPGAIREFQQLLEQEDVEEPVRDKIEQTMLALL
jgi:HEAT repeat protein